MQAKVIDLLMLFPAVFIGVSIQCGAHSHAMFNVGRALVWLGVLAMSIYQWTQIAATGQTIGKRALGIRVVKFDGSPIDAMSGVVLRSWLPLAVVAVLNIRFEASLGHTHLSSSGFGYLVGAACLLPILGEAKRGVHDYVAGTKVVLAD